MSAVKLIQTANVDSDLILRDPINERLITTLMDFSRVVLRYGIETRVANSVSLMRLLEIPDQKKEMIRGHFENWTNWIRPESSGTTEIRIDQEKEKRFLKRALNHYGYWIHDEFWDVIQDNEIIEAYGPDMIQLYRNLHFFRFCGFSLLEISTFEWYTLWERPQSILNEMLKDATLVMTEKKPAMPYRVPRHVLRERSTGDLTIRHVPRACNVSFRFCGSLMQGLNQKPVGGIATAQAELIAQGLEAEQIRFI